MDWVTRGAIRLIFHPKLQRLFAVFDCVVRQPSQDEIIQLGGAVQHALQSGWGLNIEWLLPRGSGLNVFIEDLVCSEYVPRDVR